MTEILDNLVSLLSLEAIEENLFRGRSEDLGLRQLYGGQVLGQAVSAASQTVEADRHVHSLHGNFLRPGDAGLPVVYQVERLRDGTSFSTRRVTAIQKGRPIFICSTSFQISEEGLHHQRPSMPEVPAPEDLPSEAELILPIADQLPERLREWTVRKAIDVRPVTHVNPFAPQPGEPVQYAWFRTDGKLPDEPQLHKYLLAYASDYTLLSTSLRPHGVSLFQKFMQVASLDHSLWFHCDDLRMDEWLLYAMDSPWAGNARGFARGCVFDRNGRLVASMAQEGLIRMRKDWM